MTIYDTLCTGQLVLLLLKFSSNYETLSTKEKLVERTISIRMNVLNEMNSDYFCKKRVNSNQDTERSRGVQVATKKLE